MICICFFIGIRCLSWWFLCSSLLSPKNEKNSGGIAHCGRAVSCRHYAVKMAWPLPPPYPFLSPEGCAKYAARTEKHSGIIFPGRRQRSHYARYGPGRRRWPGSSAASARRAAARLIVARLLSQLAGRRLVCGSARAAGILSAFSVGSLGLSGYPLPDRSGQLVPCWDPLPLSRRTVHRLRNAARSTASVRFLWRRDT